jgi:hypothetical protein
MSYHWQFNGFDLGGATTSTLALNNLTTNHSGQYVVVVTNPSGSATSHIATLTVFATVPLAEAVDNAALTWTTGGNAAWDGQNGTMHDSVDAAQSGSIANSNETWFETAVTGPGALTFWWKVSSERSYDFLEFYIGGVQQSNRISGEVDWQQMSYDIPAGSQRLRWRYVKDSVLSAGQDRCWVDQIVYAGEFPVTLSSPLVLTDGQYQFVLTGRPGSTCEVQASTDLLTWESILLLVNTNGTVPLIEPVPGNYIHRFYRARQLP